VRPENSGLEWSKINFFENNFTSDIGVILFGGDSKHIDINANSPDNTSDGNLKKRWIISENEVRYLLKGGDLPFFKEPYNEVIASEFCERLNIPHVPYTLTPDNLCLCPNFLSADNEFISAFYIKKLFDKSDDISEYEHFIFCAEKLGIKNARADTEKMLVVDYILANSDRHYRNFGAIRNADTLEWQSMSPIFDNGGILWHNVYNPHTANDISKPFLPTHSEQIKLVKNLSWFDETKLDYFTDCISELLEKNELTAETPERTDKICTEVRRRIDFVANLKHSIAPK
jgi:hypothetical protein